MNAADRLALGLWALDFVETASKGPWRRFAKFGRAGMEGEAYYVIQASYTNWPNEPEKFARPDELWHSPVRITEPVSLVGSPVQESPIFEQIWQAGWKAHQLYQEKGSKLGPDPWKKVKIDPDAALDELIGGSNGNK